MENANMKYSRVKKGELGCMENLLQCVEKGVKKPDVWDENCELFVPLLWTASLAVTIFPLCRASARRKVKIKLKIGPRKNNINNIHAQNRNLVLDHHKFL